MASNAAVQPLGIPFVLWALALFFLGLGFTAQVDVPLAVLALASVLAFGQEEGSTNWRTLLRAHWPLACFLLAAVLSTAFSANWRHSLAVQPQWLPALLAYSVISQFARPARYQRFVAQALLASGMLTVLLMLAGITSTHSLDPLDKIRMLGSALFIVPNDVLMLAVTAPLAMVCLRPARLLPRFAVITYLLLALLASALIGSRQAALVLLLGVAIFCALLRPRWFIPAIACATLAGLLIDWLLGWPLMDKIRYFSRTYVWHAGWLMFLDSPVLGQGPGLFKELYFPYLEKAGYTIADLPDRRNMPWAHNLYLEQLAERGVIGLAALLCLLATAFRQAWQALRSATGDQERWLAAGLLASLSAFALAGIAESTLTRLWVMVLLLTLASLCATLRPGSQNI